MGLTDTLKTVWEIAREYDNAELNQKILELQEQVGELQQEKQEVEARNRELEEQIRDLRDALSFKESLKSLGDVYISEQKGGWKGPFCTRCWEVERKAVQLRSCTRKERRMHSMSGSRAHLCPECETPVYVPDELAEE